MVGALGGGLCSLGVHGTPLWIGNNTGRPRQATTCGRRPGNAGSSSTSRVSADHRRPVLTVAYSTVAGTVYVRPGRPYPETAIYLGKRHGRSFT